MNTHAEPIPFSARLDRLFKTIKRSDGREYSHREVAEAITAAGEPISHTYVGQLRSGHKDNPTLRHMRALARFFGVPVEYFTSEQLGAAVDQELDLLAALQELRTKRTQLRASILPDAQRSLDALAGIMQMIQSLEETDATPEGSPTTRSGDSA